MDNKLDNEFDDYSESLKLFKDVYLYDGYDQDIKTYATSYIGRGEHDVVRNDSYSKCIEYDENGVATWKIVSPKNIFGLEIESFVNHKNHNKVTSTLILNSGRFDLNRIMNRFAEIDITGKSREDILVLAKSILSKSNEEIISEYGITENPKGILINSVILDSVLEHLNKNQNAKFPKIECNGENGNILLSSELGEIEITNSSVRIDEECINFNMSRKFPNCKFEVESIKGDNELLNVISDKLYNMSSSRFGNKKNIDEILELALNKQLLENKVRDAKDLCNEYDFIVNEKTYKSFDD